MTALDTLPMRAGQSKCIHLLGSARICLVGAVLGTSLFNNTQVAGGGVMNLIRDKFAHKDDIFVVNFGVWHTKEGVGGMDNFKRALGQLGEDRLKNGEAWPHLFYRETPLSHEKDNATNTCLPAPKGWSLEYDTGRLYIQPNARSAAASALVRGGTLNAPAREILSSYEVPVIGGYDYSVPLSIAHPAMRGTTALDCLHYCSHGLPEVGLGGRRLERVLSFSSNALLCLQPTNQPPSHLLHPSRLTWSLPSSNRITPTAPPDHPLRDDQDLHARPHGPQAPQAGRRDAAPRLQAQPRQLQAPAGGGVDGSPRHRRRAQPWQLQAPAA